jgi:uncharacterized protein YciI
MLRLFFSTLALLLVLHVSAQEKFMFVFLNNKADKEKLSEEAVAKIMEGHMANINRLAKEGKLLAAGPFEGGGGMFIFKSGSLEEVNSWLATDPGVQAKRWNVEVLPYRPLIGSVCAVGEKYEMTTYAMIHFQPQVYKFNIQDAASVTKEHEKFVQSFSHEGNVIAYGSFGDLDGGILILKTEPDDAWLQNDPAVSGALFIPEKKKLYIAKGSFCEK